MTRTPRLTLGVWIIIAFHVFSLVIWFIGQSIAVVNYDKTAE
jgi:hypothetical protein